MTGVLSLNNVTYSVSGVDILKQLSLDISACEYFAIAGINGAGKSTLIKLILDLIRPSNDGTITIFGESNQDSQCREKLTYLPEKFDVKQGVDGWQYLKFLSSMYGCDFEREVVINLSAKLDFAEKWLGSKVASYSKGMVQKLGLISCFMLDRALLILDEPLSGLDPRARYHFKELLLEQKSKNRTILYSTHMLSDAEEVCDQFGILHDGEMKFVGTPADCMDKYQADTLELAYMNCISTPSD
jgi:ABC-2 type transport system ATP-binding protein